MKLWMAELAAFIIIGCFAVFCSCDEPKNSFTNQPLQKSYQPEWEQALWQKRAAEEPMSYDDMRILALSMCDINGTVGELFEFLPASNGNGEIQKHLYRIYAETTAILDIVDPQIDAIRNR